jgi:hypothetical protein
VFCVFDLWLHLLLLYITKGTEATLLQLSVLSPQCWCCVLSLRCCRSAAAACISFMLLVCSALCSAPLCWYLCGGAAELCCQIGPCIAICCHPLCCCSLPPAGAGAAVAVLLLLLLCAAAVMFVFWLAVVANIGGRSQNVGGRSQNRHHKIFVICDL